MLIVCYFVAKRNPVCNFKGRSQYYCSKWCHYWEILTSSKVYLSYKNRAWCRSRGAAQIGSWEEGMGLLCLKSRQDLMTTGTGDERRKKTNIPVWPFRPETWLIAGRRLHRFFQSAQIFCNVMPCRIWGQFPQDCWGTVGVQACCHTVRAPAFPHS